MGEISCRASGGLATAVVPRDWRCLATADLEATGMIKGNDVSTFLWGDGRVRAVGSHRGGRGGGAGGGDRRGAWLVARLRGAGGVERAAAGDAA